MSPYAYLPIPTAVVVDDGSDSASSFFCFVACDESSTSQSLLTTLCFLSPLIVENVLLTRVALCLKSYGVARDAEEEGAASESALTADSVPLRTCALTLAPGQRARVHALAQGELFYLPVHFCANPANDLTPPPLTYYLKKIGQRSPKAS